MRRLLSVVAVLACSLLLSSCGLVPFRGVIFDTSEHKADAQMEHIAEALSDHDAAALERLFSPYALQGATGFDEGMEYLLSFFPIGATITWKRDGVNLEGHSMSGKKSELLLASYKASVGGKDFWLFFADFTVNGVVNPDNVGIYGLGVTPWTEDRQSDASRPFFSWAGDIQLEGDSEYGYPGIYVPNDDIVYSFEQADARMEQIAEAVNSQDGAALKALFSARALEDAAGFDQELQLLLALFPHGGMTWVQEVINVGGDDQKGIKLLSPRYRVTARGEDYRLFFADFVADSTDPENVGLASLAVTPWFEAGASDRDDAYISWAASWRFDEYGSVGIYVRGNG